MTPLVFLLRGINVGGSGKLAMADLRGLAADIGLADARTYIQSGNLVATSDLAPDDAGARLQAAIADAVGFTPDVHVRTGAELRAVVDTSPFLARGADPAHLHVTFVDADPSPALATVDLEAFAPEEAAAAGRELHLHLPGGIGRSKLATALSRVEPARRGTTRNWRTVTKLLEMVEETSGRG